MKLEAILEADLPASEPFLVGDETWWEASYELLFTIIPPLAGNENLLEWAFFAELGCELAFCCPLFEDNPRVT